MRRKKPPRWTWILFVILIALGVSWPLAQQIGPRANGPAQDPVLTLNAERADLGQNAATLYEEAFDAFAEPGVENWRDEARRCGEPLAGELVEWLDSQVGTIDLTRHAAATPDCYFPLRRHASGLIFDEHGEHLRKLAYLLAVRARLASERQDQATLADSLLLMNGLARHASAQPTLTGPIRGQAILVFALDFATVPLAWEEGTPSDREDYLRRVSPLFEPLPPLTTAIRHERDESCWIVKTSMSGRGLRYLLPPRRLFGEIDRAYQPYLDLAGQTADERFARDNPKLEEVLAAEDTRPSTVSRIFNLPRSITWILRPPILRTIELDVRTVATQRGHQAVVAVFGFADAHGRWPGSLEEVGDLPVEPYTGKPFIYRTTGDGFTLYAAGLDRDDDGGVHDRRFGERYDEPPDGDYLFWPLPERQDGR